MEINHQQMGLLNSNSTSQLKKKKIDLHQNNNCMNASSKSNFEKVHAHELKLSNKFDNLQEEGCNVKQSEKVDEMTHERMFFIRNMNIFKSQKPRKAYDSTNSKREIKMDKNKRKTICLKYFHSVNQFNVLVDNSEEDIVALIKKSNILKASKTSLKKCRTCNKKIRMCAIDQTKCKAVNQCCNYCKKAGHFPKSLNCKRRRKDLFLEKSRVKDKTSKKKAQRISSKTLKLIKKKIKELEVQQVRESVLILAEKCAHKFENMDLDTEQEQFIKYCNQKIKKM